MQQTGDMVNGETQNASSSFLSWSSTGPGLVRRLAITLASRAKTPGVRRDRQVSMEEEFNAELRPIRTERWRGRTIRCQLRVLIPKANGKMIPLGSLVFVIELVQGHSYW